MSIKSVDMAIRLMIAAIALVLAFSSVAFTNSQTLASSSNDDEDNEDEE